jgi:hypothetical protein
MLSPWLIFRQLVCGQIVELIWPEPNIMKPLCFATVLVVLVAGCASPSSPTSGRAPQPGPDDTDTYILHSPEYSPRPVASSRPPRLTVGVSDPDTQLILPWFLNDIINFINYR